eukprot:CAMPEP_0170588158 /NCGR_PEP_ID=MMETSP0224-20130122/10680_1 /TAXON_ID=285029 /ORGANISM="Togula jolla, Strain CCCM 725" /LENGTH=94 /DNA_ID=CAMNT_0010911855 /DNA_START=1050 /DNA_END=1334 /DNA_ORIENTATION=-
MGTLVDVSQSDLPRLSTGWLQLRLPSMLLGSSIAERVACSSQLREPAGLKLSSSRMLRPVMGIVVLRILGPDLLSHRKCVTSISLRIEASCVFV